MSGTSGISTGSSLQDAVGHSIQMRRRPIPHTIPPCHISDDDGQTLTDNLEDIASHVARMDGMVLELFNTILSRAQTGQIIMDPESTQNLALDLSTCTELRRQFGFVLTGQKRFHKDYLREPYLNKIWSRVIRVILQWITILNSQDPSGSDLLSWIDEFVQKQERSVQSVLDYIVEAAAQGLMDSETRFSIRHRMMSLDEIFDAWHRQAATVRPTPTWYMETIIFLGFIRDLTRVIKRREVQNQIGSRSTLTSTNATAQLISTPTSSPSQVLALTNPSQAKVSRLIVLIIFWITVAITVCFSYFTLSKGWRYSNGSNGTFQDPNYWFLIQSGCMQCLSVLTAGITIYWDKDMAYFDRFLTFGILIICFVCNILAISLYLRAPTEVTALLSSIGNSLLAFLFVQTIWKNSP